MARVHLWSLREDTLVEDDPGHGLVVITKWGEIHIDEPSETVRESLRRMSLGPVSLENAVSAGHGSGRDLPELQRVFDQLGGSVVRSLGFAGGDGPLLSAVPVSRSAMLRLPTLDQDRPLRLSRFTALRADQGALLAESPLAQYDTRLHRQLAVRVVAALADVTTIAGIAAQVDVPVPTVADIVSYLVGTGVALAGDRPNGTREVSFAEDQDPTLIRWSHHDLLFHVRSRMGRYGGLAGAVFPHADTLPSPDLVKVVRQGRRLELFRPDIAELSASDPSLTDVLENTRLCSELSDRQLTAAEVGELLFRAARIRTVGSESIGTEVRYDVSDRPYLSVHGLYELELYVSLHRCAGMARGIYHYDPQHHVLTLINESESELRELLDAARVGAGTTVQPPMLITMTARIARSSWMYGGIGYSLTLAHVGALQQTLCLVANAMGLAACAPAVDPADVTAGALRLETPAEVAVGELVVG